MRDRAALSRLRDRVGDAAERRVALPAGPRSAQRRRRPPLPRRSSPRSGSSSTSSCRSRSRRSTTRSARSRPRRTQLHHAAEHSHGMRHEILSAIDKRLRQLPSGDEPPPPRDHGRRRRRSRSWSGSCSCSPSARTGSSSATATIGLVQSMVPRKHRRVTRDTWVLIDMKLGAFVRGQFLLVTIVAFLLSLAFWLDGEPYWLLVGSFAGHRRARADRRPDRRGRARDRRRADRRLGGRDRRGHRGAHPAPARGLRRSRRA